MTCRSRLTWPIGSTPACISPHRLLSCASTIAVCARSPIISVAKSAQARESRSITASSRNASRSSTRMTHAIARSFGNSILGLPRRHRSSDALARRLLTSGLNGRTTKASTYRTSYIRNFRSKVSHLPRCGAWLTIGPAAAAKRAATSDNRGKRKRDANDDDERDGQCAFGATRLCSQCRYTPGSKKVKKTKIKKLKGTKIKNPINSLKHPEEPYEEYVADDERDGGGYLFPALLIIG